MSLAASLKDALRDQNRHWLVELFEHSDFRTLSERELSELLAAPSPLLEDELLLEKLCNHPSIHHIEVDSLANLTLLTLRLGKRAYIDFCLSFAKFRLIQGQHAENIAREALYFQGRERIEELQKNSSIRQFFKDHPTLQIECSLRNDDKEWLNDLLAEKPDITPVFTKILKWTLVSHDKKILSLSLSMVKIDPPLENSLLKVIEEAILGYNREEWIDDYHTFVLLLARHKDYPKYTALLLSWMLGTALQKEDRGLILHLFQHPSYDALDPAQLYFLIDISFDCKDDSFLKHLVHHPQFHSLSELHLGLMMEKGAQKACAQVIELAIRHQHFRAVPEDSFKKLVLIGLQHPALPLEKFLQFQEFKKKASKLLYEAIRRNETLFISQVLKNSFFKQFVIDELIHYAETDPLFVSQYIIRDVIREIFLAADDALIKQIIENHFFEQRVKELLKQSIQFDDDDLIATIVLNQQLLPLFGQAWKEASEGDKNRLMKNLPTIFSKFNQF